MKFMASNEGEVHPRKQDEDVQHATKVDVGMHVSGPATVCLFAMPDPEPPPRRRVC